jgi:hypothetical protein
MRSATRFDLTLRFERARRLQITSPKGNKHRLFKPHRAKRYRAGRVRGG